ncbi:anion permease [Citricoccus sp. GCM10030269]|uniref:inorganic phosphate transporter n=1 Tax=Citricoccus sp. GCM10030269 TaxID=3273388 RepID=UPI00361B045E
MAPLLMLSIGVILALTCCYGLLNGMRDAPNAIALPVRSRALTPRAALVLAAAMNLIGGVLSGGFLTVVWQELPPVIADAGSGLLMGGVALAVAIGWGLFAWQRGMPVSMTHALVAGMLGAAAALSATGHATFDGGIATNLLVIALLGLVLSPVLAWFLSLVLVTPATWIGRDATPGTVNHTSRMSLAVTGAANALGHGVQSGQRMAFMVALAFSSAGIPDAMDWWIPVGAGVALALGTVFGGWRIAHTLTEKLVPLDPLRAGVASAVSAGLLFVGSFALHMPLSSTHSATAAIVGAGQNQRYTAVRWPVFRRVVIYWIATLLGCATAALVLAAAATPLL